MNTVHNFCKEALANLSETYGVSLHYGLAVKNVEFSSVSLWFLQTDSNGACSNLVTYHLVLVTYQLVIVLADICNLI